MTPPKHIEEARRLATHIAASAICRFQKGRVLPEGEWNKLESDFAVEIASVLNLPTLLAAQEELAAILERLTVDKGHCPICDVLKLEQHKCYVCNLESECAKLRESSTKNYSASEELQAMHDSVLEERDQLRAERDELQKSLSDTANQLSAERVANCLNAEKIANLRTRETALMAVARAAKEVVIQNANTSPSNQSADALSHLYNALSALEPLEIKV